MSTISDKPYKKGEAGTTASASMGPLEAVVMEVFWEHREASVRQVYEVLRQRRKIAYTTVLSTARSLFAKGFLSRDLRGKAHIYQPRITREEFARSRVAKVIDDLLDRFTEPTLVHFLDRVAHLDRAKLQQLEELIEAQRQQKGKPSQREL